MNGAPDLVDYFGEAAGYCAVILQHGKETLLSVRFLTSEDMDAFASRHAWNPGNDFSPISRNAFGRDDHQDIGSSSSYCDQGIKGSGIWAEHMESGCFTTTAQSAAMDFGCPALYSFNASNMASMFSGLVPGGKSHPVDKTKFLK